MPKLASMTLLLMLCLPVSAFDDFLNAMKKAEKGDVNAEAEVGLAYLFGTGVTIDYAAALRWLQPAAEHGHPGAQAGMAWDL